MSTPGNALNITNPGIVTFDGTNSFAEITPAANSILATNGSSVPSLTQTLPTAVQGNITSLGTIVSGTWNGSVIAGQYGGTGVANTGSTITVGGNVEFSGAFGFTGTLTGLTSVTFPTSGTLATTSDLPTLPLSLADGGTNANLTASNGGIFYSTGTAGAILSGTATANQVLLSGSSTAPSWSTATYPATTTANQILYSSATNTVGGISAVIDGVLISDDAAGVPSWLPNGTAGYVLTAQSGAPPAWAAVSSGITTINGSSGSVTGATITWSPGTTGLTYTGAGSTMTVAGTLVLANGGTGASLTAVNGGVVYSGASALAISAAGSSGQILQSAGAASPTWSTATYPATAGTSGNILTSNGTNWTSSAFPTRVTTINGDSGSATGATITLQGNSASKACGAGVGFTASGSTVTLAVTQGTNNVFLGNNSGNTTNTGTSNVAVGGAPTSAGILAALTSGSNNVGIGGYFGDSPTLDSCTSGQGNVGIGGGCLTGITTGSYNLGLVDGGGRSLTGSDSYNVCIQSLGTSGDNNTLRIGATTGTGLFGLNRAFIQGINGITNTTASALVMIGTNGQMSTAAGGTITLANGTNQLDISADAAASTVNIATGGAVKTLTIGSTNSTSSTVIQSGSGDVGVSGGNLKITTAGKQLQMEGGAVTDFIGQATLSSGTVTVANTNIAATDKIFISRNAINGSSALGMFTYTISAATSFTITSVQPGTPAATETNDVSIVDYFIVRQL